MAVIVCRYAYFRRHAVPLIPVGIKGPSHWGRVWAYADSGAAYSIFDDSVARLIGTDWRTGRASDHDLFRMRPVQQPVF